jgi:hypothetical protein
MNGFEAQLFARIKGEDHVIPRVGSVLECIWTARGNHVTVAPLSKICRDSMALASLKPAVRSNARNCQYRSIGETKALVVASDKYLVARTDFDLPRASDIEEIRSSQIQDHFFPRSKDRDDFPFLDAHDRCRRDWTIASRGEDYDLCWLVHSAATAASADWSSKATRGLRGALLPWGARHVLSGACGSSRKTYGSPPR